MNRSLAICAQAIILSFWCSSLIAQNFQYPFVENFGTATEVQLGGADPREGTQLIPVGNDLYAGDDPNTIYYGLVPPNSSNKPVIVFVHGYASKAAVWYTGRDNMYKDVYNDGYRSAFVSLTPNRHMWTNGNMLSNAIDQIRNHYGVSSVVVVGWSKGGVDTDASIVHFGANSKVSEAFTLSSPHNGTSIAEVANSVLLSLVNIIFMQNNDATKSLTRGYMSYFRSITDNDPNNTVSYTTLGGWGNGPLARLDIPQTLLHGIDGPRSGGGNDGVVPYASSIRPGGRELFDGQRKERGFLGFPYYPGPSETDLDHFEVTRGGLVWPYIKGVLEGTLRMAPNNAAADYRPDPVVRSRSQVTASVGMMPIFQISEADGDIQVMVLGSDLPAELTAVDQLGEAMLLEQVSETEGGAIYSVPQPQAGLWSLELDGDYVVMVEASEGVVASLEPLYASGKGLFGELDAPAFRVAFDREVEDVKVYGTLQRLHDLELNAVDDDLVVVKFGAVDGAYEAVASSELPAGVYSVTVVVQGLDFTRTLISSVAKVGAVEAVDTELSLQIAEVYPNPFSDVLTVEVDVDGPAELVIYDLQGRPVRRFAVDGAAELRWNAAAEGVAAGLYLLELTDEAGRKASRKVVLE